MKTNEIMKSVSGTVHKVGFKLQKKSPEILVAVGIIGVVTSAVMACKATTKAGKLMEETKEALDNIHEAEESGVTKAGETYSKDDCKKDLTIAYVQAGVKFVKLYGPSVVLGAMSITSILASHNILKKRNVALAAAMRRWTSPSRIIAAACWSGSVSRWRRSCATVSRPRRLKRR